MTENYYDMVTDPPLATCWGPLIADRPDTLDKFGQLALKAVNSFNYEGGKNTYTVEVVDADAANELGVIMVVITVTDSERGPVCPEAALRSRRLF